MELSKRIISSLIQIAQDRNIPTDVAVESLRDALTVAYTKEFDGANLEVKIDIDSGNVELNRVYKVVTDSFEDDEDFDDYIEMILSDAKKIDANAEVGAIIKTPVDFDRLPQSIVNHMAQLFKHNISSESNTRNYDAWKTKIGTVVSGEVVKNQNGEYVIDVDGQLCSMPYGESIPSERLVVGKRAKFLLKDVLKKAKTYPVILSRADKRLVEYFLNVQIPEVQEGMITVKSIARVPGFKTKIVVNSNRVGVDPIGTIIGPRGERIKSVKQLINNENIELVKWADDYEQYLVNICAPAEISGYLEEMKTDREGNPRKFITIICPTEKLPLLIGKGGNNVKIINQLLDANIEVLTQEEAEDPDYNLQYTKIDKSKLVTRTNNFVPREEKTFHSTTEGLDSFEYTATVRKENPSFTRKPRVVAPKETSTDMDDFQFDGNDDSEDVQLEEVSEDLE